MMQFFYPIIGGVLIGISAVTLLALLGRIAGISGIVWRALSDRSERGWRVMFILGLPLGTVIFHTLSGRALPLPQMPMEAAIVAGFLVGFGARLGNGCTSGHGVCGLGLMSLRSLLATLSFMATAVLTVFILRHMV